MIRTPAAIEGQGDQARYLPTPTVSDLYTANLKSTQQKPGSMHSVTLAQVFNRPDLISMLPTPTARDFKDGTAERVRNGAVSTDSVARAVINSGEVTVTSTVNWGKFAPAVERWAKVIGRPAPAPTLPDGKDGTHRLNAKFTEWLMGLPDNWITEPSLELSRADQLKMAGNGVCPQQAELALRILLDGVEF